MRTLAIFSVTLAACGAPLTGPADAGPKDSGPHSPTWACDGAHFDYRLADRGETWLGSPGDTTITSLEAPAPGAERQSVDFRFDTDRPGASGRLILAAEGGRIDGLLRLDRGPWFCFADGDAVDRGAARDVTFGSLARLAACGEGRASAAPIQILLPSPERGGVLTLSDGRPIVFSSLGGTTGAEAHLTGRARRDGRVVTAFWLDGDSELLDGGGASGTLTVANEADALEVYCFASSRTITTTAGRTLELEAPSLAGDCGSATFHPAEIEFCRVPAG